MIKRKDCKERKKESKISVFVFSMFHPCFIRG
jgi:hypothetical protein